MKRLFCDQYGVKMWVIRVIEMVSITCAVIAVAAFVILLNLLFT